MHDDTLTLERVFSSKGKVKILSLLSRMMELNISEIAKQTGLNYTTVEKHLRDLMDAGIINEKKFGRVRVYGLKEGSNNAQIIKDFINVWEKNNRAILDL